MKNIRFKPVFCSITLLLLLIGFSGPTVAAKEKLIIKGSIDYPPLEFIDKAGEPAGFNVDIIKALMDDLGYEYEIKLDDWDSIISQLHSGKVDIIMGMLYSEERAKNRRYSLPICHISRNIITRKEDNYKTIDDLRGKSILAVKGGWSHQYIEKHNITDKIIDYSDISQAVKWLAEKKYDAVMTSGQTVTFIAKEMGIYNLDIMDFGIAPQNYSIVVNQGNDSLLYKINTGLQNLKISGKYDQIYNKWFTIYEKGPAQRIVLISSIVFIIIAMILLLFVWLLRKQIRKATSMLVDSKKEVEIAIAAGRISAWAFFPETRTARIIRGIAIDEQEMPLERVFTFVHPDDFAHFSKELEDLSNERILASDFSVRLSYPPSSPYRHFEMKMVLVKGTKDIPKRVIGTLKDVSEYIVMQERLEEYRIKTEAIIKTNGIILMEYDIASQCFIRINDDTNEEKEIFPIKEYISKVHPDDINNVTHFIQVMNSGVNSSVDGEYRILTENNKYDWFNVRTVPYRHGVNGNVLSYIGMRRNNTKWKNITSDLIILREKAEASNKLKSAFLANMSHEIRTPLNAIVGFSELISETEDSDDRKIFIDIIKTNNELLLKLISDVLDLSRIEAGYINFEYTKFNFAGFFHEIAASLKLRETPNIKLIAPSNQADLVICSDKGRITQVITNLVTNAFKFTKKGSVTLDYSYENNGVKITITDTGIGIAEDNQNKVFDRFEKVDDFAQGTGLGLSICRVIIEALQGRIGLESEYGVGSTFWFWIPCDAFEEDTHEDKLINPAIEQPKPTNKDTKSESDKKSVLIAEDIDSNYLIVESHLKDEYNLIWAKDGLDAVLKAKEYEPDLILMDMKMPIMNGLDATKEIRKFNVTVPIIALTAYVFDTNKEDALFAGCNEFITKPLKREQLINAITNLV